MDFSSACIKIISQLTNCVSQIKEEDFCKPSVSFNGATIGQHLRHTIEFFLCLEKGLQDGVVNYDKRDHDEAIENSKIIALEVLERIAYALSVQHEDRTLTLEVSYDPTSENFTSLSTTYNRELIYNIEHAVHHMAIIKIGIREIAPYVELPPNFGIAVSTIRHQTLVNSIDSK